MSWNYRLMKTRESDGSDVWGVHEVYYDDLGGVKSWTENSVSIVSETCRGLRETAEMFHRATLQRPLDATSGVAVPLTLSGRPLRSAKQSERV